MQTPAVLARVATLIIVVVVVIVGGILAIDHTLTYGNYFRSVATGVGLLGIGYGIDSHSKP